MAIGKQFPLKCNINDHKHEKKRLILIPKNAHENNSKLFFIYQTGKHFVNDNIRIGTFL